MVHPLPPPPFCHSKSQAAITSPLQPRNPTLLRPPCHRCPAGASSSTTSSTATARRPSATSPDEDPSSISPSRRFSRPVLHLQGAAPTIASSIVAAPSPQRRLNLLHRNRRILTGSSDEAEAYSAQPKRLYTHRIASHLLLNSTSRRQRCSIPHPHGAATLKPAPRETSPRRLSPNARSLRRQRPYQPDLLLLLLRLLLDHSLAQLLLLSPSLVLLLCFD